MKSEKTITKQFHRKACSDSVAHKIQDELKEFLYSHDLDEEEYEALESWVSEGNSPYENPDHYCDSTGMEVNYMKWYWILADPLHPERRALMNHRHRLKDETDDLHGKPQPLKEKAEEFISMDYSDTTLSPGQDWYIGGASFLSLEETKEHLLTEMKYIKTAFQKLLDLENAVEYQLSDLDLTGNLFEDVLNVGELLAGAEIYAEDFISAYSAINRYEDTFRHSHSSHTGTNDLPF